VCLCVCSFFFQAADGIRDFHVTGVQTCALPIWPSRSTTSAVTSLPYLEWSAVPMSSRVRCAPACGELPSNAPYRAPSPAASTTRSEERRVGKERRYRRRPEQETCNAGDRDRHDE